MSRSKASVTGISVYPIKSTAGIALESSDVEPAGLARDRRLMLVDKNGMFITGRRFPMLTQVFTGLTDDGLVIRADGRDELQITTERGQSDNKKRLPVRIWKDHVDASEVSGKASAWFSDYLGFECLLVGMSCGATRATDRKYSKAGDIVSFADAYPLLLISEASLADLNKRLPSPFSMQRFRPNVVLTGTDAYEEDGWQRIRIGDVEFDGVKNCSRCVFTTVDPVTGEKHPGAEPLKTLMSYRRDGKEAYFGQNLVPRSAGSIRVGDMIEVIETAEPVRPS